MAPNQGSYPSHREFFRENPDEGLRDIKEETLNRFEHAVFQFLRNDRGLGNHEFIALSAHRLDEDRHLQFPPSADFKRIGPLLRRLDPEGHVPEDLQLQALAQMTGSQIISPPARPRAGGRLEES